MIVRLIPLLLLLAGAARAQVMDPAYSGRIRPGEWKKVWTTTLAEALNSSGLYKHRESQIESLCPGYDADRGRRRELFWQELMIALSWKESLHGPGNYVHFNGGINDGLFQINPVLRTAYGCGSINLFNAQDNIRCAVKMAARLVNGFGSFLHGAVGGMAAYWQPLRADSHENARNRAFILAATKTACKTGALNYESVKKPMLTESSEVMLPAFNTLENLGLRPEELEPLTPDEEFPDAPATFRFDPRTGLLLELNAN